MAGIRRALRFAVGAISSGCRSCDPVVFFSSARKRSERVSSCDVEASDSLCVSEILGSAAESTEMNLASVGGLCAQTRIYQFDARLCDLCYAVCTEIQ